MTQIALSQSGVSTSLQFVPITPCRIADTRNAAGAFGAPKLSAGTSREFDVPQSGCGIPANAAAYSLNVTVVPDAALGYLTLFPSGTVRPNVSTLNSDGRVKANAAITSAGVNGGVSVYVSDAAQVILDIDGYFVPTGTASALSFYPVTPCRVADTRSPNSALGGPFLASGVARSFPVQSSACGIPTGAQAYSMNITAVPRKQALGYLSAWAAGQQPMVSTLNASTGVVTANAAIVPTSSTGGISLYASDDSDVVLDINGYFAAPSTAGLSLYPATSCRIVDTRSASGSFSGVLAVSVQAGACSTSTAAQVFVLNATVVPSSKLGYLSLFSEGQSQPAVSTLNANDGVITSNLAIVSTGNGSVDAFASSSTNLILDTSSYFAPVLSAIIGGPYSGTAGQAVSFDGSNSVDPFGQTLSYYWSFGDGTTGTGIRPTHTYSAPGTYTVFLVVADANNLSASVNTSVTVTAALNAPVAVVVGPYAGIARLAFNFDGSASRDPQGQALTYMWNFGDGTTGVGANPTHTYQVSGSYQVSLVVVDTSGLYATATTVANIVNQGTVYNGLNPLSGAKLYVLAANTTGYGQASKSLLTSSLIGTDSIGGYIRTQGNGGFTITGNYTCSPGDQVYLYVDGTEFSAGTYMGVLGDCPVAGNFAAAIPSITVNQVTTVAAAFSLAGFATDPVHISSSGNQHALSGVGNAFATAGTLASITSGKALSDTTSYLATYHTVATAPQATVNSLANIVANAAQAIDIAHHPATSVLQLYALQSAKPPFQPALGSAPNDWTLSILYEWYADSEVIDSQGNIWGSSQGVLYELSNIGIYMSPVQGFTGGGLDKIAATSIAIDPDDSVWVLGSKLSKFSKDGSALTPDSGITGNGLTSPDKYGETFESMISDGEGSIWITNGLNGTLSKFLTDGSSAPNSPFSNSGGLFAWGPIPESSQLAADASGNIWLANLGNMDNTNNSTVSEYNSLGFPAYGSPFSTGINGGFSSIAIDRSNTTWESKIISNAIFEFTAPVPIGPTGNLYTAGKEDQISSLTFDGDSNLWGVSDDYGLVELSHSGVQLSPSGGYGPAGSGYYGASPSGPGLAIDQSGNIWVPGCAQISPPICTRGGLFKFVGLAAPVNTPLSYAVKTNTLASRP